MKNVFTKFGKAFFTFAVAILFLFVSFIFVLISNGTNGYSFVSPLAVLLSILALLAVLGACALAFFFGPDSPFVTLVSVAAIVLAMFGLGQVILERAVLASALFTYDSSNTVGWNALITSGVAGVLQLLGSIAIIVGGFFSKKAEEQPAE